MLTLLRSPQRARGLLILGICLLLLISFPPSATLAATKQQEINNALDDFKDGKFQRSSLSALVRPPTQGDKLADKIGAVQLGPIGLLKTWAQPQFTLPKALYRMGAASFGNRIFLIGGFTPNTGSLGSSRVAEVWSTPVSLVDGSPINETWDAEPSLPAVVGSTQTSPNFAAPTAPVASPAVTTVADSSGLNGYIYVIGGNSAFGTFDFSSFAVRIGTVTNGRITGWLEQTGAQVPQAEVNNPFSKLGVQSAVALSHAVGGTTYVYLIGGLQRYLSGGVAQSGGLKTVFYARVGSGGKLFKPSSPGTEGWDRLTDLTQTLPFSAAGIWEASGTADNYVASSVSTSADAIYIMGGQLNPNPSPVFSSIVYRATINSDGTLTWDWQGTMPSPQIGSTAIPFRGNMYVNGGQPDANQQPVKSVLTSYVEDDLGLHQFDTVPPNVGGSGTNFLTNDALPKPRAFHASVLIPAGASSPNAGFLYILGGLGATDDADTTDDTGANTMIYGKIGGGEDISSTGYASDGWYYGNPFDVAQQFSQVQVQEVNWTTVLTRTTSDMDIEMDYRLSSSNNCATATWGDWIQMTGATDGHRSATGQNSWPVSSTTARCFQYRAKLTTQDTFATPILLNVSVKIIIPGSPDLSVKSISDQRAGNAFTGLNVLIQNVNLAAPPTLAADVEGPGSFYVDMCIFGPGTANAPPAVTPPTLPLTSQNKQCSKVYANINKSAIGPDSTYPVSVWYDTATDKLADLHNYFKTPGVYSVVVAVDSYVDDAATSPKGFVDEGEQGEGNNVSQTFTFTVQSVGYGAYLPQMRR
jgi:hypothetical protein